MNVTKARLARLAAVLLLMAASLMAVAVAPPAAAELTLGIPGRPRAAAARIDVGGKGEPECRRGHPFRDGP
jgi:hypothetical protein